MVDYRRIETDAKAWATGHLVAAAAIAALVGFVLGALLF